MNRITKRVSARAALLLLCAITQGAKAQTNVLARPAWEERMRSIGQLCRAGHTVVLGRVTSKTDSIVMENCRSLGGLRVARRLEFDSVLVTDDRRWDIDLFPKVAEGDALLAFGFAKPSMGSIDLNEMVWTFSAVAAEQPDRLIRKKMYPAGQSGVIRLKDSEVEEVGIVVKQYWDHLHNPDFDLVKYQQFLLRGLANTNELVRKNADIDLQNLIIGGDVASLREMASGTLLPEQYRAFAGQALERKLNPPPPPLPPPKDVKPPAAAGASRITDPSKAE